MRMTPSGVSFSGIPSWKRMASSSDATSIASCVNHFDVSMSVELMSELMFSLCSAHVAIVSDARMV